MTRLWSPEPFDALAAHSDDSGSCTTIKETCPLQPVHWASCKLMTGQHVCVMTIHLRLSCVCCLPTFLSIVFGAAGSSVCEIRSEHQRLLRSSIRVEISISACYCAASGDSQIRPNSHVVSIIRCRRRIVAQFRWSRPNGLSVTSRSNVSSYCLSYCVKRHAFLLYLQKVELVQN